jgi:hypothetical protein
LKANKVPLFAMLIIELVSSLILEIRLCILPALQAQEGDLAFGKEDYVARVVSNSTWRYVHAIFDGGY